MGAAREVTFSCLAEPTIFSRLHRAGAALRRAFPNGMLGPPWRGLAGPGGASLGLILVCLSWCCWWRIHRIPFDDPNTHLELTMVHEVMVLDHSGPAFGMILYGAAMKLLVLGALVVRLALPWQTGNGSLDALVFLGGQLLLAVLIGVVESVMARLRLVRIPQMLIGTTLISVFALVLLLR